MFNKIARRLFLVLLGLFFLSGSNCGQNDPASHPSSYPSLGPPTAAYGTTGNANGGPGAQASSMNGAASVLANMISEYRAHAGLPTVSANDVLTGVAQVQADDMAASNAVGLIGTDGEDAFQRLANSGYTNTTVAVIAAGYSTDTTAVYNAMLTDNGANQALLLGNSAFSNIGVGYSNGYWMVILGNTGTGTGTGTLSAPTLSATAGTGSVALSWTAVSGGTSYHIYRGTVSGGETSYQTGIATTSYSDTTVTGGTTYYYTVTAVNSSGSSSQSNEVSATPTASSSLQITTTTLAVSVWDASLAGYSSTIAATGGTGTVTFTAGSGLPPGLTLGASGSLTGTPTTAGTYNFTVTATDSVGTTATKSYTLLINPAVSIVTTTVPNGTTGTAYNAPIQTAGGTGAITLSVTSGSLPPGIALGSSVVSTTTFVSTGLNTPDALAFDAAGNLYVANLGDSTIAKVTPAGVTSTFVNAAGGLSSPTGLAFDSAGNLYVANRDNNTISKVTPAGVVSTFVNAAAGLNQPIDVALDTAGNLYVVNGTIVTKVTPAGVSSTFASGFNSPCALRFDSAGNLYVTDTGNNTVEKVTPAGVVSTFVSTAINGPLDLVFDTAGNLYVANTGDNTITKVTPAGVASTYISTGVNAPAGLAMDTAGNLYIADSGNNQVTMVPPQSPGLSGTPTTAGTYNFTVTATDTLGDTATQAYTVTIP